MHLFLSAGFGPYACVGVGGASGWLPLPVPGRPPWLLSSLFVYASPCMHGAEIRGQVRIRKATRAAAPSPASGINGPHGLQQGRLGLGGARDTAWHGRARESSRMLAALPQLLGRSFLLHEWSDESLAKAPRRGPSVSKKLH